jgi:hypothetical protein
MSQRHLKVLLSSNIGVYDINNKWLPMGVHNFYIDYYTENGVIGKISEHDFVAAYEFDYTQFVKLMAKAQTRLAHKGNVILDRRSFRNNINIPERQTDASLSTEPETCSICLNICYTHQSTTPCNHIFHTHCITAWIRRGNNTCPICRQELSVP